MKIRGSSESSDDYIGYTGVDDLLGAGHREQNRQKRQQVYDVLMGKMRTDLPIILLSFRAVVAAWRAPAVTMIDGINNNFLLDTIRVQK